MPEANRRCFRVKGGLGVTKPRSPSGSWLNCFALLGDADPDGYFVIADFDFGGVDAGFVAGGLRD